MMNIIFSILFATLLSVALLLGCTTGPEFNANIRSAERTETPLRTTPFGATSLGATPLGATPFGTTSLGATPISVGSLPLPSLAPVLSKVSPAVVNIAAESLVAQAANPLLEDPFFRQFFDLPASAPRERIVQGLGSGVIIDARRGYIVTSQHVVEHASQIRVTLHDGRQLRATLVTANSSDDLALLKIQADQLQAIGLADSDRLEVGDFVIAIGNPFGLGKTATVGIVSALGRQGPASENAKNLDFIQTDASINPGNSGGPLVDLNGQLVGINSAILAPGGSSVGIGFAIPAKRIQRWLARWL